MAIEGLPEELLTLIVAKLPVESLLRSKCVQKSWYSLIKSPQFIHLHLTSRNKNHDCFIARRFIKQQNVMSFYSYETLDDLGKDINIPISNCGDYGEISLSDHCNGLVCITNFNTQVLICNPATREFRSLFVPPTLVKSIFIESVALGSDPNTGQYKVVMIAAPRENIHLSDAVYKFLVFDFSNDSWRETAINPGTFRYWHRATSFNGAFHWSPLDDSILTFRISDEVAGTIPLPDFVDVFRRRKALFVSSKSQQLCVVFFDLMGEFDVCVMTEYGVKESWTRLYKIGPLTDICEPTAFWDEQRLLLTTRESQLVSYDLIHQSVRHFPIHGDFYLFPYSESLVSVYSIGE